MIAVGTDIVQIKRIQDALDRLGERFVRRILTADEREEFRHSKQAERLLAKRFAAKEAMAKALGAPVGMAWHDAEVVSESSGRPVLTIRGSVQAQADAHLFIEPEWSAAPGVEGSSSSKSST